MSKRRQGRRQAGACRGSITLGRLVLAVGAILAVSLRSLAGQARTGEASIRVMEVFDPATGQRTRRVARDLSPTEIRRLERALADGGWLAAEPDGVLDDATREALRRFQRDRNLTVCACPSYETVLALGLTPVVTHTVVGSPEEVRTPDVPVIRPAPAGGGEGTGSAARPSPEGEAVREWIDALGAERLELLRAAFGDVSEAEFRHGTWLFPFFPFVPSGLHRGTFPGRHRLPNRHPIGTRPVPTPPGIRPSPPPPRSLPPDVVRSPSRP